MITRHKTIIVNPSPEELAAEFAEFNAYEQAAFFVELARLMKLWDRPAVMQLQAITDNPLLTTEARSLMAQIGEYAWPYNPPKEVT
jgi:hypothetical protein